MERVPDDDPTNDAGEPNDLANQRRHHDGIFGHASSKRKR
jgi:hypothetical protein